MEDDSGVVDDDNVEIIPVFRGESRERLRHSSVTTWLERVDDGYLMVIEYWSTWKSV